MDTSVIIFIKVLNVPRKKHKRNWEHFAVVHWLFYSVVAPKGVFECLSVNLALQKFFQTINFCFTRTTKRLQPVTTMGIFPPRAIKYHKIPEYSQGKWPTVLLFFATFMANSSTELSASCSGWTVSRHIYTSGITEQLSISVYAHTMARPCSGPDSCQLFSMPKVSSLCRVSKW